MDKNFQFWGNGDRKDIGVSYEDYLDMLYCLHDERLSTKMMLRFKNLREVNMWGIIYVPIFCFPVAYIATNAVLGPVRRMHGGYRNFWTLMSLILPLTCWHGYTTPLPRRLYTDILCSNDLDGTYVRSSIKIAKPGLWRRLSRELYDK